MNAKVSSHAEIDVTREICPMTYVRVRLALDRLAPGEILSVKLRGEDAARNVPASAIAQGHSILEQSRDCDDTTHLLIKRKD